MRTTFLALAVLLGGTALAHAEGELQLYNWGDYTNPELIKKFEAETGIKVTITDYDSNDTALAKIEAGGHGFDLVVPSNSWVPIYIEKGLIQKLDMSSLHSALAVGIHGRRRQQESLLGRYQHLGDFHGPAA